MDTRRMSDVVFEQPPAELGDGDRAESGAKATGTPPQNGHWDFLRAFRASDIEPYTGLRYLSKLFRFMAIVLLLLLAAELVTGLYAQGAGAIPTLLGEASRLIVLAGVLWGTGDLAHLLIDVGHDVRAARILLARQVHAASVDRALLAPISPRPANELEGPPPPVP